VFVVWLSVALAWIGVEYFDQTIAYVWGIFAVTLPLAVVGNLLGFRKRMHLMPLDEPEAAPAAYQP